MEAAARPPHKEDPSAATGEGLDYAPGALEAGTARGAAEGAGSKVKGVGGGRQQQPAAQLPQWGLGSSSDEGGLRPPPPS